MFSQSATPISNPVPLPKSTMSLFIPRVFPNASDQLLIANTFHSQGLGQVSRIDLNPKYTKDGVLSHYECFIHFMQWYPTAAASALQKQILDPSQTAYLIYNSQTQAYWILNECHNPESDGERKLHARFIQNETRLTAIEELHDDHVDEMSQALAQRDAANERLLELLVTQSSQIERLEMALWGEVTHVLPDPEAPLVDGTPVEEFDLHHDSNIPDSADELPKSNAEEHGGRPLWQQLFYKEAGGTLSSEWRECSDAEKLSQLNSELDELQDYRRRLTALDLTRSSNNSSPSYTSSPTRCGCLLPPERCTCYSSDASSASNSALPDWEPSWHAGGTAAAEGPCLGCEYGEIGLCADWINRKGTKHPNCEDDSLEVCGDVSASQERVGFMV